MSVNLEYLSGVRFCIDTPAFIPMFCDWLDEHDMDSSQWRKLADIVLPHTKWYRQDKGKCVHSLVMYTSTYMGSITVIYDYLTKQVSVKVSSSPRPITLSDKQIFNMGCQRMV